MLPAEPVMRAAVRWLGLLRTSTLTQAANLIRSEAAYTDLTQTQYSTALEWLRVVRFLSEEPEGFTLSSAGRALPQVEANQLLFERTVECSAPAWLLDSDVLIPDEESLPHDAAVIASTLGLSDTAALWAIRNVHGRVDTALRSELGLAGERALIELLERHWPGTTLHVSASNDGFGYDVLFRHSGIEWHLEVKTTLRRGRLVAYVSRHEYEVSLRDPHWRLVVVGLNEQRLACAVATVQHVKAFARTPKDTCLDARWQSVAHQLTADDLREGLSFINAPMDKLRSKLLDGIDEEDRLAWKGFAWMPH
jgi:hypothetical protein